MPHAGKAVRYTMHTGKRGETVMEKRTNENKKGNENKPAKTEKTTTKTRKRKNKKENANDKLKKWLEKL